MFDTIDHVHWLSFMYTSYDLFCFEFRDYYSVQGLSYIKNKSIIEFNHFFPGSLTANQNPVIEMRVSKHQTLLDTCVFAS